MTTFPPGDLILIRYFCQRCGKDITDSECGDNSKRLEVVFVPEESMADAFRAGFQFARMHPEIAREDIQS